MVNHRGDKRSVAVDIDHAFLVDDLSGFWSQFVGQLFGCFFQISDFVFIDGCSLVAFDAADAANAAAGFG